MGDSGYAIREGRSGVWDTARGVWLEGPRVAAAAGEEVRYFLGLDLGQAADYTALAIVRRTATQLDSPSPCGGGGYPRVAGVRGEGPRYEVVGLTRFPLGTPYAAIAERVASLLARPPLNTSKTKLLSLYNARQTACNGV